MGSDFSTALVYEHEIAKNTDFQHGFESIIRNAAILDRMLVSTDIDYIVGAAVTPDTETVGIRIGKLWGNGLSLDLPVYNKQVSDLIPITPPPGDNRLDTVQVRGILEPYDNQRRAFYNPDTDTGQFWDVETKERLIVQYQVKQGVVGQATAPEADTGWIKLAEILVRPEITEIDAADVHNITAIHQGEENQAWTTQKARTFLVIPSQELQQLFLVEHTSTGAHGQRVIKNANIDFGVNTGQVNGKGVPFGQNYNAGDDSFLATDSLYAALVKEIVYRRANVTSLSEAIATIGALISDIVHDAPADGRLYGRKNQQWSEVVLPEDTGGDSIKTFKLYSDTNLTITNALIADRRLNRYDIGLPFISPLSEVYHFDTDLKNQNQTSSIVIGYLAAPILVGRDDSNGQIYLSPAMSDVAPYENPGKSLYGMFSVAAKIPNVASTVEFWLRLPEVENIEVFRLKTPKNEEFIFNIGGQDIEYSVPDEGDIPYSVPDEGDIPYSAAPITNNRIDHSSPKGNESINMNAVEIRPNTWVHIAFVATQQKFALFIGNTYFEVTKHYQTTDEEADILINGERDTVNIDELTIDRSVALAIAAFISNTTAHIPYAGLDYTKKWAVLMFDNPNRIVTNLFEGEQFRNAVLAVKNNT
ncbi:hypothetical protein AGMMS49944_15980 [Spirochaetia bacterium]|nr:hypothetical protein AGMMS49944_15980 [Spirochaetia bacterium]